MANSHEKALKKGKWNAVEKRYNKSYDAASKSYNKHAKHNPKTGHLELSKSAPKRAHSYYKSLGE